MNLESQDKTPEQSEILHKHNHGHAHHTHGKDVNGGRLIISIFLNLIITLAEVIGGILSNSLALLSDALHNFSDTASLGISYGARRISKKEADEAKTFGYKRAEIIGAFINLIILVIVSLYLVQEGIHRFFEPEPINGPIMLIVAIIGLIGNFLTAWLLFKGSKENINIRSAYLHILSDTLSSVGVIIASILIMYYQIYIVDTLLTIGIAIYILVESYIMLKETISILMESTPGNLDLEELARDISTIEGVNNIHHIHIWKIDENNTCLEAHIHIDKRDLDDMEQIKGMVKNRLDKHFNIGHSTLEFEFEKCKEDLNGDCVDLIAAED
ncbi:MAG TPA: cation diffusion facilitator family transporter [Bacteroidales bacterium]|nr:cation diffusion facilitator family transporter [Bacteroidales bacterium]